MGLFDTLNAQTPQGEQLRGGLLGMGAGLLQGSTGHYGQFAPALGQGMAGLMRGRQDVQQTQQMEMLRLAQAQKLQQQARQQQEYENFFKGGSMQPAGGAQSFPVGDAPGQPAPGNTTSVMGDRIQQAINSGNPNLVEWGFKQLQIANQGQSQNLRTRELDASQWSAPQQSPQGFFQVNRVTGESRFIAGPNGQPVMPTTIDPTAQGNVAYAKSVGTQQGKVDVERPANTNVALTSLQASEAGLDRLGAAAQTLMNHPGTARITGIVGMAPNWPGGDAADAQAELQNLKSQVGFSVLQAMRDASKTGGALGQVSDKENEMLQNNLAALQNSQSLEQFKANLQKIIDFSTTSKDRLKQAYARQYGELPQSGAAPSAGAPDAGVQPGGFSNLWGG